LLLSRAELAERDRDYLAGGRQGGNMDQTELTAAIIAGDRSRAAELTKSALDEGRKASDLLDQEMIPAMEEVGDSFAKGELFIPEMLIAAEAMKTCLALVRPLLSEAKQQARGTVVLGTVKGDIHDLGKNVVSTMLEGAGFGVVDLGVDVSAESFVAAAKEHGAKIIGLSALTTTTMPAMKEVVQALSSAGMRDAVKVMIGGAPVTEEYAHQIGADAYEPNAAAASKRAKQLIG
jgi:5-methyltetrahydrofolate--homocysteine methyltransferase